MPGKIILLNFFYGLISGLASYLWSSYLIRTRALKDTASSPNSDVQKNRANNMLALAIWMLLGVIFQVLIGLISKNQLNWITNSLFCLILLTLSRVDIKIRKIPNPNLLALIVVQTARLVVWHDTDLIGRSVIGLLAGFFIFQLPVLTGRIIGWGDVKLAAVTGYCLGWLGLLYSIIFMGLIMGLFSLLLIMTKRGNLKSIVAIGPFLSLGMLVSVIFSLG